MESSLAVANYFLQKGFQQGISISNMKLQKLVYIAHGYFLAIHKKPLINETILAWKYGPVIDSLYHKFRRYGNRPITILGKEPGVEAPPHVSNDEDVKELLEAVWEGHKNTTALQLSSMTHKEGTPWQQAKDLKKYLIPENYMERYYTQKIERYSNEEQ